MKNSINQDIDLYIQQNKERFEQDLCDLLRIPSVSAQEDFLAEMDLAARWLGDRLEGLGFSTEYVGSKRPILIARSPKIEGAPTIMIYGHYDVQPPEPLELWTNPPFEPTIRDGNIFARGATDDKGQLLAHVFAAEAWVKTTGSLPVNLIFLIEGEEEVGSLALEEYVPEHTEELACDCIIISDCAQLGPDQPAITYGLKGIAYFELRLQGANRDLHSGTFGGGVTNPCNVLAKMLASLVDERGKVTIPGFYDEVVDLTPDERQKMADLPISEAEYFADLQVEGSIGEEGYTPLERRWARPTYDVNGIYGGYQGEGSKTVLPEKATAKFSFRLVPNQDPEKIHKALEAKLEELCPLGITMELIAYHGSGGMLVPLESPYMRAASRAITHGFGVEPYFIREGGSIPVVATLADALDADTLLLGWGQTTDNTHGPDENFALADYHRGMLSSAQLLAELAALEK